MELREIQSFSKIDSQLCFEGKPLAIDAGGGPIRQYAADQYYLLFLADDPFEDGAFDIRLLDKNFKCLENHYSPNLNSNAPADLDERVKQIDASTIRMNLGDSSVWHFKLLNRPKYQPRLAWNRMKNGWLPIAEYAYLLRSSPMAIRKYPN